MRAVRVVRQCPGAPYDCCMPCVNVRITRDGVTAEQKALIVGEITATLVRVLGKRPEHIHVIIDEVEAENWGLAGVLTTEYRKKSKSAGDDSPV